MASLAEQISQLTNTAPKLIDPEDDVAEETSAVRINDAEAYHQDDGEDLQQTSLRRQNIQLLSEGDVKYSGKKISRKKLKSGFGEISDDELESDNDDDDSSTRDDDDDIASMGAESDKVASDMDDSDGDEEDEELDDFKAQMKRTSTDSKTELSFDADGDFGQYGDEDDMSGVSDDDSDEEDDEEDEEMTKPNDTKDEDDDDIEKFSKSNIEDEIAKGKAAKCQLNVWDQLLETRIKLQKNLVIVNQLPLCDTLDEIIKEGGDDVKDASTQAVKGLKKLLDALVQLQNTLMLQYKETKHIALGTQGKESKPKKQSLSDEEITSESEDESDAETTNHKSKSSTLKRKIALDDYPQFLSKRHADFKVYRNATIQKWYDKTRLASGKLSSKSFSVFDQSAVKQIDQILSDKPHLVKRTQLKRSPYRVLGDPLEKPADAVKDENLQASITQKEQQAKEQEYNTEIFDDDDFYHQLLRELIERKTTDLQDPIELSRQWLEIQKLRNKTKRKVDTRASKGRKIRYDVHQKLVNFMAPVDNSSWTEESRNDLYSSLFGKRQEGIDNDVNR
ncbi:unnamed protein product [Owenia fusiformis]|uniref:Uncharacterized protein n=1 Tax=Owenia fusiformis TaxID=6347 RepID=A0A8J1TFD3_OWEFU|nr:unnamed protein product [Owenia fusiformis]